MREEIELVQCIFTEEECQVSSDSTGSTAVTLHLRPNVGEDGSKLFVLATLTLRLPVGYPAEETPAISLGGAKGLDDAQLGCLLSALQGLAQEQLGEPVILQLSEATKDFLDQHNGPSEECAVCLDSFGEAGTGACIRLDCFHCFHDRCFARWWLALEGQANERRQANPHARHAPPVCACPVCRSPVSGRAQAELDAAVELETREARLVAEAAAAAQQLQTLQDDGSDKEVKAATARLQQCEAAVAAECERLRVDAEAEARREEAELGRASVDGTVLARDGCWLTAEVRAAQAARKRLFEKASARGGLIDAAWLRRIAASGSIAAATAATDAAAVAVAPAAAVTSSSTANTHAARQQTRPSSGTGTSSRGSGASSRGRGQQSKGSGTPRSTPTSAGAADAESEMAATRERIARLKKQLADQTHWPPEPEPDRAATADSSPQPQTRGHEGGRGRGRSRGQGRGRGRQSTRGRRRGRGDVAT